MNIKQFFKKHWFILTIILLFLLKIIITNCQIIYVKSYVHDDYYFVKAAQEILKGNWLGSYNDITLSKGISGILFIVFSYKVGVSYLSMLSIFYFIACISVIKVLHHFISSKLFLILLYTILLFHPISYSDSFNFVYRDGLYAILLLLLFSCSFEIYYHIHQPFKLYFYTIFYSFILTFSLLCREETICILPYVFLSLGIVFCYIVFQNNCKNKILKCFIIIFIPISLYTGSTHIISYQNLKYYNRFVVNDFNSKDFKDLYGALTRIKQENYIKRVPLNKESRDLLYEKSPLFKELEPYLESDYYKIKYTLFELNDYQEGFLYWAIREAGGALGYYKDANTAYQFHTNLANEINQLCDQKELECSPKRSSLVAPIHKENILDFFYYIPLSFYKQITFQNVMVEIPEKEKVPEVYKTITRNNVSYENKGFSLMVLRNILWLYKNINPSIVILSILLFLDLIPYFIKNYKKNYHAIFILSGLLFLYLFRIIVVGMVATLEYESALFKAQYLSSAFPIQTILSFLIFYYYYVIKIKKKDTNTI